MILLISYSPLKQEIKTFFLQSSYSLFFKNKGYYFGEVDLLFGETRRFSYRSKTPCVLLSLSKKNFQKIFFNDFREIGAEIYNNALKRRVRAYKVYKEALAFCEAEAKEAKAK